jgi:hypothetical protein
MGKSPEPSQDSRRARWVALVTGGISILVAVLYLLMIVLLDSRGPLQPPPPEALGLTSQSTGFNGDGTGGEVGGHGVAAAPQLV